MSINMIFSPSFNYKKKGTFSIELYIYNQTDMRNVSIYIRITTWHYALWI